jgi:hypothetical protein
MEEDLDGSGNGHSTDGMMLPRKTVTFRIGEEDIEVPSLRFQDMDDVKESLKVMEPTTYWLDYAGHVLRIVAHQMAPTRPELTFEALRTRCTGGEATVLATQMNELLWASGFPRPSENPAEMESPGTGTSTGSVSGSQPGEPVEVIL